MSLVVATVSGGLDSVTLAHTLAADGHDLVCLSFDYGQRHAKEVDFARACADRLGADHHVVDLRSVGALLAGSALTDPSVAVPEGHYTDASMAVTVVPNRNAIMLAVAVGVATARGAAAVAAAVHAGDHTIYPDCRPAFIEAAEHEARLANEGFIADGFRILAPFVEISKADIVRRGAALDVPFAETWSCYIGGERHCGRCGTCVERREAFELAGVDDPTVYETVPA
ncbi:MAG TPA: 7-cyano-7-deazaguanine synthase QueC [Acidimicrobiales bacterium]|nr:7-cyano-7-deazaguanine synthase QueC [Acidimicrobiales bacterium]